LQFKETAPHDLFFWAVLMGNEPLALLIFHHCEEEPLRIALMAASLCRQLGRRVTWAQGALQDMSRTFEGWAVGMLEAALNASEAYAALSTPKAEWGQSSVLDLALELDMKSFIDQHYAKELGSIWWQARVSMDGWVGG
jgi:hypothetical protein